MAPRGLVALLLLVVVACGSESAPSVTTRLTQLDGFHFAGPIPTDTPEGWSPANEERAAMAFFDGDPTGSFATGWGWELNLSACDLGATDTAARTVLFKMELAIPDEVTEPYCEWFVTVEQLAIGTNERSVVGATESGYEIDVQELVMLSRARFRGPEGAYFEATSESRATAELVVTDDGFTGTASLPFGGLKPTPEFVLEGGPVERPLGRGNLSS
jgi:hypothetical protein